MGGAARRAPTTSLCCAPSAESTTTSPACLPAKASAPRSFPPPSPEDLGDHLSASLLRSALRIGFRSTAGPFRCLASIAVEPRAYQLVPLMMALRQNVVRLLIADDVGIGKTIEAALVATELLESRRRPRLSRALQPGTGRTMAERTAGEIRPRSRTRAAQHGATPRTRTYRRRVDLRALPGHRRVHRLHQVRRRRHEFLRTCPDLVIVDEVHTCVADSTTAGSGRTQRYELVRDLAADPHRHLILASATPHSGKDEAFRNLLGLLDPKLATVDLEKTGATGNGWPSTSSSVAERTSAGTWTRTRPFPKDRLTTDVPYSLSPEYRALFDQSLDYARETVRTEDGALAGGSTGGRRSRCCVPWRPHRVQPRRRCRRAPQRPPPTRPKKPTRSAAPSCSTSSDDETLRGRRHHARGRNRRQVRQCEIAPARRRSAPRRSNSKASPTARSPH